MSSMDGSSPGFGGIHLWYGGETTVDAAWNVTDQAYRSHHHVLYRVCEGSLAVSIDDAWHTLVPGDVALMTAGHWHRRRVVTPTRKQFVHFSLASVALHQAMSRRGGMLRWPADDRWGATLDRSCALWNARFALQAGADPRTRWALEGLLQHTIAMWLHDAPTTVIDGAITRAVDYLDGHACARPSVAIVAQVAELSERRLAERFHEALGLSVAAYAEQRRMTEAEHLLRTTDLSVAQVAERCGYPDPLHFSRVVRRHFGRSPRHLRG